MYTEQSVDRVREADIVTIVSSYCQDLKKKGATYFCLSPFKQEKTPSFNVNPVKNNWVCYATSQAGDGIKFIMLMEKCTFPEALEKIRDITGVYLEEDKSVTPEEKAKREDKASLINLNNNVALKYQRNFEALEKDHWSKKHIHNLGYQPETLIQFQIGYASNVGNEITKGCIQKGKLAHSKRLGLTNSKDNRDYDFFRDRIMFPICNPQGNVVGFGGRRQNGDEFEKYAKYINTKETEIYKKESTLYGFHLAKKHIAKKGFAILSEGYTDVITMHDKGCNETIASCGTALTKGQIKLLKRLCEHVVLFRDGDAAGVKSSVAALELLLNQGFRVSIIPLPEDQDPDSWARGQVDMPTFVEDAMEDAVLWRVNQLKNASGDEPFAVNKLIKDISDLLFNIKNEVIRDGYVKEVSKITKQPQKTFKNLLGDLKLQEQSKLEKSTGKSTMQQLGLPEGADHEQFLKDRFCEVGNQYYFQGRNGFFPGTNCKITPLFHIQGKRDNKRLCEVINTNNQKKLIDIESDSFVSFSDFKKQLIRLGYFIFLSGTNTTHFDLLAQKILKEFATALELQNMGWHPKGFFAFANGAFWNGEFVEVDPYGIMQLTGVDKQQEKDEYTEEVEYYYSAAFSVMHKKNQEGDDPYENDRKFIYKESPVSLKQWMDQMLLVYEDKGRIGTLFVFASCFRDLFLKKFDFFPHLGCFGEKGSGKSAFGKILQNFFFTGLDAFELNTSTLVGFSRRLTRTRNTVVFLDEYNEKIHDQMFQGMKGAYQGIGREKGMATSDNRTKTDKVNSALCIGGQYLPTRDDNALQSRTISLQFPLKERTLKERENFNTIKKWSEQGMSSLVLDIVKYRSLFEDSVDRTYSLVVRELKKELGAADYEERVLGNYASLLITYKILDQRIDFPFSYEDVFKQAVDGIIENSESIKDSSGLTEFWNVLQWMFEHRVIREGFQFSIDTTSSIELQGSKKEKIPYHNPEKKELLFLRLKSVHQDYVKEVTKREGVDVIGETTLRNYFKSRNYFIGLCRAKHFKTGTSSCYVFDYTQMKATGVVSLEQAMHDDSVNTPPSTSNKSVDEEWDETLFDNEKE